MGRHTQPQQNRTARSSRQVSRFYRSINPDRVLSTHSLNGATVCVAQGTTHEVTLGDYGRANGIEWKPLVFDRTDTMYQTFFGGRCDVMTQDASALAGAVTPAGPNPPHHGGLPQTISKEPPGPLTPHRDEEWTPNIPRLHYGPNECG